MKKKDRLDINEVNRIRDELTLQLCDGPTPFAGIGDDAFFGPDDWAWLFLSLNSEYRDAYAAKLAAQPSFMPGFTSRDGVLDDDDGSCASRFGLAAWVNPIIGKLPRLPLKYGSWFFPLMRLVVEDYRRNEVSEKRYVRTGPLFARYLDKYPHLVANETAFGYRRPAYAPSAPRAIDDTMNITWAAIDCSVPPDAQVQALQALSLANREALMQHGWKTNDSSDSASIIKVGGSEVFGHMQFLKRGAAQSEDCNVETFWRAVQIDVLGPIAGQMTFLLRELKEVHVDLVAGHRVKVPLLRRFRNSLPSVMDSDGVYRNGGNYLKALHILAELVQWGHSGDAIAQIIAVGAGNARHINSWRHNFLENLEQYVDAAQTMVAGGYKYLIYAQKPDAS